MKKLLFLSLLILFVLSLAGCAMQDSLDADAPNNHIFRDPDQQSVVYPDAE
ncbi:hypothetical protein J6U76_01535 [bacterium]|jgi:hypothetical protein|nr:hypothetical protein [bacterium]MBO7447082.1 hypothetical protein [bacterium]MBP5627725.1 hypothetical protein [bacterium]MBQ7555991.1 hypothetical protein [bacterium]MBR4465982.1 hypothetical protein [bacterium]